MKIQLALALLAAAIPALFAYAPDIHNNGNSLYHAGTNEQKLAANHVAGGLSKRYADYDKKKGRHHLHHGWKEHEEDEEDDEDDDSDDEDEHEDEHESEDRDSYKSYKKGYNQNDSKEEGGKKKHKEEEEDDYDEGGQCNYFEDDSILYFGDYDQWAFGYEPHGKYSDIFASEVKEEEEGWINNKQEEGESSHGHKRFLSMMMVMRD